MHHVYYFVLHKKSVCLHTQASNKDSKVFISLQRSDLKWIIIFFYRW